MYVDRWKELMAPSRNPTLDRLEQHFRALVDKLREKQGKPPMPPVP